MLDGYVHFESLLIGALVAVLPLMAGLLIQRRSFRNASTMLEEEVRRLRQTAATGAEEVSEAMAQRDRTVQAL